MRQSPVWACVASMALIAESAVAQWVTFENQTATRMPTGSGLNDPATSTNDPQQKAYAWGDVDHDGDIDLICVRAGFAGTARATAVLFMNEGIAEGHATNGVLVDRTLQYATASNAPSWDDPQIPGGAIPDRGFLTPTSSVHVVLVDLNSDGWLDIVTCATKSDNTPNWIGHPRIYINLGAVGGDWQGFRYEWDRIPFLGDSDIPAGQPHFMCVAAGDVTGDGYADLYFTDSDLPSPAPLFDYNNKLLINEGAKNPGYFVDSRTTRMSANPGLFSRVGSSCAMADMNADGALDVVKLNVLNPYHVAIQLNDSANVGHFPDSIYNVVYNLAATYVSVGDLNQDGRPDLVITDDNQDRYLINKGNEAGGAAQFLPAQVFLSQLSGDPGFGGESRIADLDNDGWSDVLIADVDVEIAGCSRRTRIFHNLGNAPNVTLEEQNPSVIPISNLTGTHDIAVFDLDGDGWNDIVLGRCNSTSVWRNTTPIPGDVTGDHRVNVADLLAVINGWGPCPGGGQPCPADLNHDGVVNVTDLIQVINHWG